jgi:hypothetical protein
MKGRKYIYPIISSVNPRRKASDIPFNSHHTPVFSSIINLLCTLFNWLQRSTFMHASKALSLVNRRPWKEAFLHARLAAAPDFHILAFLDKLRAHSPLFSIV